MKRPGSPKISNFARIPFQITSCANQGTRQNLIVLDKNNFCMWACWIFLIEFCLFFVLCWKQIFEFVFENLNTFQSFQNKHCVLCKQPGHILILIHTMADTWSMKYFRVLLKNFSSFVLLRGSYLWCKGTCPCCQTSRKHPRYLSLSDAIIAKARTGRSVPSIVIADTQGLSTRRVLIHGTNVQSLSERTYQQEYCKNMLFPTLVIYVTMLVIFAAMASTMHGTFILHDTSLHIMTLNYK